ncbi:MAG: hypothetical protein U9Q67_05045, partial [Patescibacteria group bacterium]|nr:hypothetical protein [Patescibacteria group bacterium]
PWLTLINSSRNLSQVVCYLGTCKVGHKLISTVFSGEIADSMRVADGHTLVSLACEAVHRDFPKGLKNLDKDVMLVSDYKEDIHIPKRKMYELMDLLPRASLVELEGSRHYAKDKSKVYEKIVEFLVKSYS